MIGNFYFEKAVPRGAHYVEGAAARDVIERSGNVIACLAGHTHWNARNTIDGVHYITIHSLTESFTTHPYPTGAFGILSIDESLTVEVFGRDPALHRLPIKPLDDIRSQIGASDDLAFVQLRRMVAEHHDLMQRIDEIEERYDENFQAVFHAIRALINPATKPAKRIGYLAAPIAAS